MVSCHWVFRMIINYRSMEGNVTDHVGEAFDKVVFNDPDIVKKAMDDSTLDADNSNVEQEIYK